MEQVRGKWKWHLLTPSLCANDCWGFALKVTTGHALPLMESIANLSGKGPYPAEGSTASVAWVKDNAQSDNGTAWTKVVDRFVCARTFVKTNSEGATDVDALASLWWIWC